MSEKAAAFGEIMLRLSTPSGAIRGSKSFDACYGGTEANVLACLAAFGHDTEYLTALPDNTLGEAVKDHLRGYNVGTDRIVTGGDTLGIYFVENGSGSRGASVIYNRRHSEFTRLDENSFDYDKALDGVALFHISGISFALSKSSAALAFRLMKEAKSRGAAVSFDFNYRAKLWTTDKAKKQFVKAVASADIVLSSDRDLEVFLRTTPEGFFDKFGAKYLIVRNRTVLGEGKHSVNVTVYKNTDGRIESYATPQIDFDVAEKVGGGDAFDGAMLHRLLTDGNDLKAAAQFAVGAFVLKHSVQGDTFEGAEADVMRRARDIFKEDFYA